jgi:PmbA protein
MPGKTDPLSLLSDLLERARKAGADAADALFADSVSLAHTQRLGATEKLEREESREVGLRVFIGRRQAAVSSTDFGTAALDEMVERALAMARTVPEDPHCGLAPAELLARDAPDLDLADDAEPTPETLRDRAGAAEDAARAVPGVTNSEGAEASWGRTAIALAGTNGFAGAYATTRHGVMAAVIAGEGTAMEIDYESASAVYGADLEDPEAVGRRAGERAVRRLKPRKAKTAQIPVVLERRLSNSLLGHLAQAISGAAIARHVSFLQDAMGEAVFAPGIVVVDDPHRRRGLRSKPFDGEGVANRRLNLVEDGVLRSWLLDLRSARQLGLTTTGHAARGTAGPPSPAPTNLYMEAGRMSPKELVSDIAQGLFVTDLIGFGVNTVTGDYSRGAAGLWIENGEVTYPVSEVTVASNLKDMFRSLVPADDLEFRYGTNAPTIRIDGMTLAGQ